MLDETNDSELSKITSVQLKVLTLDIMSVLTKKYKKKNLVSVVVWEYLFCPACRTSRVLVDLEHKLENEILLNTVPCTKSFSLYIYRVILKKSFTTTSKLFRTLIKRSTELVDVDSRSAVLPISTLRQRAE